MSKNTEEASEHPHARGTTRRRPIDMTTLRQIARLCSKGLNESESCRRIGLEPKRWQNWKLRHARSEKFGAALEHFRAERFDTLLDRIEAATTGEKPDWRASAHLLAVADPRFRNDSQPPAPMPPLPIVTADAIAIVVAKLVAKQQAAAPKALPGPANESPKV